MKLSEYVDKKMIISSVVASFAVVGVAILVNKFLPDTVPGAATVKSVANQAAA